MKRHGNMPLQLKILLIICLEDSELTHKIRNIRNINFQIVSKVTFFLRRMKLKKELRAVKEINDQVIFHVCSRVVVAF